MSVIPQTPELPGGLAPLGPLPGLSPTHASLTTNPGSAPAIVILSPIHGFHTVVINVGS